MSAGSKVILVMAGGAAVVLLLYCMFLDPADFPLIFDHVWQVSAIAGILIFAVALSLDRKVGLGARSVVALFYGIGASIFVLGTLASMIVDDRIFYLADDIPGEREEAVRFLGKLARVTLIASIPATLGYGLRWMTFRISRRRILCDQNKAPVH